MSTSFSSLKKPFQLDFLLKKRVFLFDLDGTLYLGDRLLPGARGLVNFLREHKKKLFFFTNNSSRSDRDYLKKLKKLGLSKSADEIVMSTHSLILFLKRKSWKKIYLLGTPAMTKMLSSSGIKMESRRPQCVVVGFDKTLTYEKLWKAARLISSGCPYVLAHPDYFCPTDQGPEPDCGSMGLLLEKTTGVKPAAILGKPHPLMVELVRQRSRAKASEMLLIGDRLMTDILMAKHSRIDSVLVLTGDSQRKDLQRSKVKSTYLISGVESLLRLAQAHAKHRS